MNREFENRQENKSWKWLMWLVLILLAVAELAAKYYASYRIMRMAVKDGTKDALEEMNLEQADDELEEALEALEDADEGYDDEDVLHF